MLAEETYYHFIESIRLLFSCSAKVAAGNRRSSRKEDHSRLLKPGIGTDWREYHVTRDRARVTWD